MSVTLHYTKSRGKVKHLTPQLYTKKFSLPKCTILKRNFYSMFRVISVTFHYPDNNDQKHRKSQ